MERTIKFRGINIETGKWVYGNLLQETENCFISATQYHHFFIYPNTKGQFTGLKDKKGVDIYEGDVIKITDPTSRKEPFIAEVAWSDRVASFYGFCRGIALELFLHNPIKKEDFIEQLQPFIDTTRTIEVIGNIYENPDLIGKDSEK